MTNIICPLKQRGGGGFVTKNVAPAVSSGCPVYYGGVSAPHVHRPLLYLRGTAWALPPPAMAPAESKPLVGRHIRLVGLLLAARPCRVRCSPYSMPRHVETWAHLVVVASSRFSNFGFHKSKSAETNGRPLSQLHFPGRRLGSAHTTADGFSAGHLLRDIRMYPGHPPFEGGVWHCKV